MPLSLAVADDGRLAGREICEYIEMNMCYMARANAVKCKRLADLIPSIVAKHEEHAVLTMRVALWLALPSSRPRLEATKAEMFY